MIVLSDDELFCLMLVYFEKEMPENPWLIIERDSPWEHLRECNLLEACKTRIPITQDDMKYILYQITPEGSIRLNEIETSRLMGICSEHMMWHLLIPFIAKMEQEELPELITHPNVLIRKMARERCDEIRNRLVRRGAKLWKAGK